MSVEAFVIASAIEEGSLKKAFQAGIAKTDFTVYEEEWTWLLSQVEMKKPLNWRRFMQTFPDFEKVIPNERLQDLCEELKLESAFMMLTSALNQVQEELSPENAVEKADFLREIAGDVMRLHAPASDVKFSETDKYLQDMKNLQLLRENGEIPGISTGIPTLDAHWGGLQGGRTVLVLGRPGDAKSFFQAKVLCAGFLEGRRMAMFSPEMNEEEHRARIATLLSADPRVQEELGLVKAFRNRALLDGKDYNYKTLRRFWKWFEAQPGEIILYTQKMRRQKMTPAYIESKIDDYGIEAVTVDPIYKLKSGLKRNSSREELEAVVDQLCDIAEMHDIPIVMSNQAHRQQGNRGDAPHKDNSFNSDAPVQEADVVVGVKYISDEKKLVIRCTKNRFGHDFRCDLRFVPNIGIMQDVSFKDPEYYNGNEDGSENHKFQSEMKDLES